MTAIGTATYDNILAMLIIKVTISSRELIFRLEGSKSGHLPPQMIFLLGAIGVVIGVLDGADAKKLDSEKNILVVVYNLRCVRLSFLSKISKVKDIRDFGVPFI